MDPLSEVLSLLKPRTYVAPGLDAGGDWALQFPVHEGIKFNAVIRGSCWLAVEGDSGPHHLEQGDCFLLTSGQPFVLASDLALRKTDAREIYSAGCDGIARCQGGGDFFLVGGRFAFNAEYADALFGSLPAVVPVSAASDQAHVLRWALELFAKEINQRLQLRAFLHKDLALIAVRKHPESGESENHEMPQQSRWQQSGQRRVSAEAWQRENQKNDAVHYERKPCDDSLRWPVEK